MTEKHPRLRFTFKTPTIVAIRVSGAKGKPVLTFSQGYLFHRPGMTRHDNDKR